MEFILRITFSCFLYMFATINAQIPPKNQVALTGSQVTFKMDYGFALDSLTVTWEDVALQMVGQGTGYTNMWSKPGYNLTHYDTTSALTVEKASLGNTYRVASRDSPSYFAELIVLNSDPVCTSDPADISPVKEGTTISLRCAITFSGKFPPTMEWQHDGQVVQGSTSTIDMDIVSEYVIEMTPAHNNKAITTTTYFEVPTVQDDSTAIVYARNAPDYRFQHDWNTIVVHYSPRNIVISPSQETYYPGDQITCSADGSPAPTMKWLDSEKQVIVSGPTLNINEEMIGFRTFTCQASNIVEFTDEVDSYELNISVITTTTTSTTPSTTTTTQESTTTAVTAALPVNENEGGLSGGAIAGIIIAVMLIIVIIIILIYCCLIKDRNAEDKAAGLTKNQFDHVDAVRHPNPVLSPTSSKPADVSFVSEGSQPPPYNPYTMPPRDGVMYADCALDDTPRSRKPIQVYENPEMYYDGLGSM